MGRLDRIIFDGPSLYIGKDNLNYFWGLNYSTPLSILLGGMYPIKTYQYLKEETLIYMLFLETRRVLFLIENKIKCLV